MNTATDTATKKTSKPIGPYQKYDQCKDCKHINDRWYPSYSPMSWVRVSKFPDLSAPCPKCGAGNWDVDIVGRWYKVTSQTEREDWPEPDPYKPATWYLFFVSRYRSSFDYEFRRKDEEK